MTAGGEGERAAEILADKLGILCLSERRDDILMWSHYASSHCGVCLEFDTKRMPFEKAGAVNYCEKYPVLNAFKMDRDVVAQGILCTKSKHCL